MNKEASAPPPLRANQPRVTPEMEWGVIDRAVLLFLIVGPVVVLGGGAVSYERGTPVGIGRPGRNEARDHSRLEKGVL